MVHQNRSNFRFWLPVQIWNDLWPIILCNLKTKHRRYIKLYIFWILMTRQTIWHYLQRNRSMFQFSAHMELSRSMAAILEMPQYVAYQKNVVCAFIKLSAKSHSFNILCTMDGLSCPTIWAPGEPMYMSINWKYRAPFMTIFCDHTYMYTSLTVYIPVGKSQKFVFNTQKLDHDVNMWVCIPWNNTFQLVGLTAKFQEIEAHFC